MTRQDRFSQTHNATPTEWKYRGGRNRETVAMIRRLEFGDHRSPEVWFRVVTLPDRELVGYVRDLERAATLAFEYACALESWQHERAGRPGVGVRPSAADLARAYREAQSERRPAAKQLYERDRQLRRDHERAH
jgi:hypothetical protein